MRIVLIPAIVFIDILMWVFRANDRQRDSFDHFLDCVEDMLDDCYPHGTLPMIFLGTLVGFGCGSLFGNDLPPHGGMTPAVLIELCTLYFAAILILCLIVAIGTLCAYYESNTYQPSEGMLGIWMLVFCASIMIDSFGLGYFIVPGLL